MDQQAEVQVAPFLSRELAAALGLGGAGSALLQCPGQGWRVLVKVMTVTSPSTCKGCPSHVQRDRPLGMPWGTLHNLLRWPRQP